MTNSSHNISCSTLYYDGRCSLCRHEIKLMSRMIKPSLRLVDIHHAKELPKEPDELLAKLHLKTESGDWVYGLDASVTAWQHTPIGFLFAPLRWPLIKPLADKLYTRWAKQRFCKLPY